MDTKVIDLTRLLTYLESQGEVQKTAKSQEESLKIQGKFYCRISIMLTVNYSALYCFYVDLG